MLSEEYIDNIIWVDCLMYDLSSNIIYYTSVQGD